MPVDPSISRQIVAEEMRAAERAVALHSWAIELAPDGLSFVVRMNSRIDGEVYILEVKCDDYKELPPHFEFLLATGERRVPSAYPVSTDSFFHGDRLICYPFNRGAYNVFNGPHADWALSNWSALCPESSTLGDMLLLIQHRLDSPDLYKGRGK
jgi:hypothetical protein